jgi:hypothetical protein
MNTRNVTRSFTVTALALAGLAAAVPAAAEETSCTGRIGSTRLDNVFVPDGASCTLERTRLNGSVVVGRGATLYAVSVVVNGNIQAEGAASVVVTGTSTVGGSVQLVQGGSATVERARITGDLLFDENSGPLAATRNTIGGNLQAFKNVGGAAFNSNTMKGNMQCKENTPAPTGRGNVSPSKEDQCARL